jgi:trans-aconitate methyltransferase
MSADEKTLAVYAAQVARYAEVTAGAGGDRTLLDFMTSLPKGAHMLDLGCGPGHAAAAMVAAGFTVDAVDASPEMVAEAQARHGLTARVARFDQIDAVAAYDGVWASFSLLHAPKAEMPGHLARLHRALKPRGRIAIGLKTGVGEKRDRLGRFYAYYDRDEIEGLMQDAGFTVTARAEGADPGLDGTVAPWIVVHAHA